MKEKEVDIVKPSRFNYERLDMNQLQAILTTGSLDTLRPEERAYFSLMELVRGLRQRMTFKQGNQAVTKAGIIKLLKNEYGVSDWMARRIYADSLNFFYQRSEVTVEAFRNLYAEKAEEWADRLAAQGDMNEARSMLKLAGEYRGCFNKEKAKIPDELLNLKQTVIYTADSKELGVDTVNRQELEEFIDSIPEISDTIRQNLKEDAGIRPFDIQKRMTYDMEELAEDAD